MDVRTKHSASKLKETWVTILPPTNSQLGCHESNRSLTSTKQYLHRHKLTLTVQRIRNAQMDCLDHISVIQQGNLLTCDEGCDSKYLLFPEVRYCILFKNKMSIYYFDNLSYKQFQYWCKCYCSVRLVLFIFKTEASLSHGLS